MLPARQSVQADSVNEPHRSASGLVGKSGYIIGPATGLATRPRDPAGTHDRSFGEIEDPACIPQRHGGFRSHGGQDASAGIERQAGWVDIAGLALKWVGP